jgi:hypothetical protein
MEVCQPYFCHSARLNPRVREKDWVCRCVMISSKFRGEMKFETKEGVFTEFNILPPIV